LPSNRLQPVSTNGTTPASDGGATFTGGDPDAGSPLDAGSAVDGGTATGACIPTDAGTPAAVIEVVPCPGTPPLLWSRTFSNVEVDFRGAADENGNLYWVEYDPPPTFLNPTAPAFLVSADSGGQNHYRVPAPGAAVGGFLLMNGNVVMSQGLVVTAYASATGARSWSLDLSATQPAGSDFIGGMTDLGNGKVAFSRYAYAADATSLYVVDATSGSVVWSTAASASTDFEVLGSDGAGSMLVTSNPSSSYPPYQTTADVAVLDSSGQQIWKQRIIDGPPELGSLLAWSSSTPWLSIAGNQGICSTANYTAVPAGWFGETVRDDLGFLFSLGATATSPDNVQVLRSGAVLATGPLAGTNAYDGLAVFPFLAGDHVDMLGQLWHSIPAICHPSAAGAAWFGRVDAKSLYQCPLTFVGESGIEAAALLRGRLIVGRRTYLTDGCTHEVQPVTIEAYALPGESLAASGWVQREGSPGLGWRPRAP
jgi:hypothetical protein